MISHEHKCIFIHIPKCAGTSIESALGHHEQFEGRGTQDHRTLQEIKPPAAVPDFLFDIYNSLSYHRRLILSKFGYKKKRNLKNRYFVNNKQYKEYFKFTIVRNPWSRCYSYYRAAMRDEYILSQLGVERGLDFSEFMHNFGSTGPLRPQLAWILDPCGDMELDFVGRFENLRDDFALVCRQIGADPGKLPHKLRGGSSGYKDAYCDELRGFVGDMYAEEIAMFGYEFDK